MLIKYDFDRLNNIVQQYKKYYEEFFNRSDIQDLLEKNEFEQIYRLWPGTCRMLTALFILADNDFMIKMRELPNQMFYSLPITSIIIPPNIKSIMTGNNSGWTDTFQGRIVGKHMFGQCEQLKEITFDMTEEQVYKIFNVNNLYELTNLIFKSHDNKATIYFR